MKKFFIGIAVVVMAVVGAKAQDTVVLKDIRTLSRYMIGDEFPYYPSEFGYGPDGKTLVADFHVHSPVNRGQDLKVGYRFITDDTLDVYGIAAAVFGGNDYLSSWPIIPGMDTSSYYAYMWLMLFDAVGDSLVELVDTSYMYVHAWQRPNYYLKLDFSYYNMEPLPVVPIHERYFPSPVTVTDSFYVGHIPWQGHEIESRSDIAIGTFSAGGSSLEPRPTIEKGLAMVYRFSTGERERGWWRFEWSYGHPIIFPILAPPDTTGGGTTGGGGSDTTGVGGSDTTGVGGSDTTGVGIDTPEWAARYVSLSPNPASDKVQVVSSFGLAEIEVFDAKGQSICCKKASGYKCTLDVASWPRGAYVVRIGTGVGTVAKKLLLK